MLGCFPRAAYYLRLGSPTVQGAEWDEPETDLDEDEDLLNLDGDVGKGDGNDRESGKQSTGISSSSKSSWLGWGGSFLERLMGTKVTESAVMRVKSSRMEFACPVIWRRIPVLYRPECGVGWRRQAHW